MSLLEETMWPAFGASDPDDLAVILSAALRGAGVEHRVLIRKQMGDLGERGNLAIELRGGADGRGALIASLPLGNADIEEANAMLLAGAIEEAGRL
jgi:hypothetical protein